MSRFPRSAVTPLIVVAAIALLAGCGGETIVRIDGSASTVSASALDHWMQALAGSDFREQIGTEGPAGLASEPADYHRCFNAAKLVAPRSFFNQLRPGKESLNNRCHELHSAIKQQALHFLISAQWSELEAAERHLSISDASVREELARIRRTRYPSEADLRRYLTERQWSLADLLYELKHEMLQRRLWPKSIAVADEFGGKPGYEKLATEQRNQLTARTRCERGYVVPGCSSYRGERSRLPQAGSIIYDLVHLNN
jgi:hypothetical protein